MSACPARLGAGGIEKIYEIKLTDEETAALHKEFGRGAGTVDVIKAENGAKAVTAGIVHRRPASPAKTKRRRIVIVQFCVLASGSTGNAAFLATSKTRILIDAGLSVQELTRRLAEIGEKPEDIDAVLITHEHSDHVSGLPRLRALRAQSRRSRSASSFRGSPRR